VNVSKSSLVAMLLEAGEENAAVLLARSAVPDEIDTGRDLDALVAFGLDRDQVDEIARLTIGALDNRPRRDEMDETISRRWAELVDRWGAS
jgi:predicted nucleotidyltransferase